MTPIRPTSGPSPPLRESALSPTIYPPIPLGLIDPIKRVFNRLAGTIVGSKLATNVIDSAKLYAQLNYALANAAFAAWDAKSVPSSPLSPQLALSLIHI